VIILCAAISLFNITNCKILNEIGFLITWAKPSVVLAYRVRSKWWAVVEIRKKIKINIIYF